MASAKIRKALLVCLALGSARTRVRSSSNCISAGETTRVRSLVGLYLIPRHGLTSTSPRRRPCSSTAESRAFNCPRVPAQQRCARLSR